MEVKTEEGIGADYLIYHISIAGMYVSLLVLPGLLLPRYGPLVGTLLFATVLLLSVRSYALALFSLRKAPGVPELPALLPTVSIIIPSYNEESVLPRTIQTALALDYPANRLELIYVYESICSDRTEEIIRRFADEDSRIKPVRRPTINGGKAAATNYGLKFATGDIIGVFDADHSLNSDLVLQAVSHLQREEVACVRGRSRAVNRTQGVVARLTAIERDIVERLGTFGASQMDGFVNMSGGHGFVRRDLLEQFGGFDEEALTEDIELSAKFYLGGYVVKLVPEMQSWEESPITLHSLIQQRRRWARGWMQVWRNHASSIWRARSVPVMRRLDVFAGLTSSVVSGFLIAVVPLMFVSLLGVKTSFLSRESTFWLWLFVTTAPVVSAGMAWTIDRAGPKPPPLSDLLYAPLLVPYTVFFFGVSWICLVDEFILSWPFAYVKTKRVNEESLDFTTSCVDTLPPKTVGNKRNNTEIWAIDASATEAVQMPGGTEDGGNFL